MKKTHLAATGIAVLVILVLVTVAKGIGGDVAAAEDERFRINGTTLTRYVGTDTFVSIPDNITAIGEEAFAGNETLTGIELPSSLTTIAYNAFKDCTVLESIIIPDSVTKIGPGAFEGCTELASVQIGKGVSSWGSGVFINCDKLAKVSVDRDNSYITYYNGAIYNGNMTMLYQVLPGREGENYVMPDSVKDIDAYAFWNMQNTINVKVSSNVGTIPKYAFTNMGSVENVAIQNTTTGIAEKAFADNVNLKQVVVPASVSSIDKRAFSGSPDMKIFTSKSSTADSYGKNNNIEVIYKAEYPDDFMDSNTGMEQKPNVSDSTENTAPVPDTGNSTTVPSTTDMPDDSDTVPTTKPSQPSSGYAHPLDVPEPDNVKGKTIVVAGKAVVLANNHNMTVYGIPKGVHADVMTEQQYKDNQKQENTEVSGESPDTANSVSVSYQRPDSSVIAQRKYYKQKDLTTYKIEEEVRTIGRLAFAESGLKEISIPGNVTEIEYGAFMGCSALADVTIPDTVSSIGTKAFEGTPWLKNWFDTETDSDFLVVGDGVLIAYKGTETHVTIPDGVKVIGSEVFKGHTEILDAELPASVTKISAEAFRNCKSLTGLTGCEGLRTVIRGAFYGTQISESEFLER